MKLTSRERQRPESDFHLQPTHKRPESVLAGASNSGR